MLPKWRNFATSGHTAFSSLDELLNSSGRAGSSLTGFALLAYISMLMIVLRLAGFKKSSAGYYRVVSLYTMGPNFSLGLRT